MAEQTYSERILRGGGGLVAWQRFSRFRQAARSIRHYIPTERRANLLDVGAADGIGLPFLKPLAGRVLSVNYYANHTQEFQAAHPGDPVITADVRSLPLADGSFDVVVSFETLHLLPGWSARAEALAEIHRVLRVGGLFVCSIPIETGPSAILKYCARRWTGHALEGMTLGLAVKHGLWPAKCVEGLDQGRQVGFNCHRFVVNTGVRFEILQTKQIPIPYLLPMNLLVVARK